jgi:hypothetical protein
MQDGFAEAALNTNHKAFGYALQPLSAAHLFYLEAVRSPVFTRNQASVSDLLFAAKVCAEPVRLIGGTYRVPDPKPSLWDMWQFFLNTAFPKIFNRNSLAWVIYATDHMTTAAKMDTPDLVLQAASSPGILASVIRGSKLFSEGRAWSMPYGLLRNYIDIEDELAGGSIRFCPSEEEQEQIQAELEAADAAGLAFLAQHQPEDDGEPE